MKIIKQETHSEFKNGYTLKKITAEVGGDSDIDIFIKPSVRSFSALFKNEKIVGIVTAKNESDGIIVPTLLKIDLVGKGNMFGIFNVKDAKMIYKGASSLNGNEVVFTPGGFIVKKIVELKSGFDFNGKNKGTKIVDDKSSLITIGEVLDQIDVNDSVDY